MKRLGEFFTDLDLDARDSTFLAGLALLAVGITMVAAFGYGIGAVGLILIYVALRRPPGPTQPPENRRTP